MKILEDRQLGELQTVWQHELGVTEFRSFTAPAGTDKEHFLGSRAGESKPYCFIKVTRKQAGYLQERAASDLMVRLGYPSQTVLGHGQIGEGTGAIYWLAFPWLDCETVSEPTDAEVQEIGHWIGKLHRQTTGLDVPGLRNVTLAGEFFRQIDKLRPVNAELSDALVQRYERVRAEEGVWEAYEQTLPRVMVHGDFGWRNVIRKSDGELLMIDYEHSMIAPCWMDFGKALDRNLEDPKRQQLFLAAYREEMGPSLPELRETYHGALRLWQVAGIYNFTERAGDATGFRDHGNHVLQLFDRRWSL